MSCDDQIDISQSPKVREVKGLYSASAQASAARMYTLTKVWILHGKPEALSPFLYLCLLVTCPICYSTPTASWVLVPRL